MIIKPVSILLTVWLFVDSPVTTAQLPDYKTRIQLLNSGIEQHLKDAKANLYYETTDSSKNENLHSWLWPLCALIQGTNEMESLYPKLQLMLPVEKAINQYFSNQPPLPAYQDYVLKERKSSRFYDDNQWIAIAYLDAYNRNHQKKYLKEAQLIYRWMLGGIDTVSGGGMYWKEGDFSTKNTCSNGPGILVALQLYKITRQKQYLDTAFSLYRWTNKNLQAPNGVYYDNIKLPSLKIATEIYTYNTGTMLQANVLLFEITKDKKYLAEAQRIAKAGKDHFFKNGRLPNEYWFNAVLLRGYQALYNTDHNRNWIDFFKQDADFIWKNERDHNNLLGIKTAKRLIDQAAMIEIYARLQEISKAQDK